MTFTPGREDSNQRLRADEPERIEDTRACIIAQRANVPGAMTVSVLTMA